MRAVLFDPLAVGNRRYVNAIVLIITRRCLVHAAIGEDQTMKNNRRGKDGFTLVEIMIVVAIIGLLASIAIPSYAKSRRQAYTVTCINNLQKIDGAMHTWSLEMRKDDQQQVTYSDIRPYLRGAIVCPSGGTSFEDSYTVTSVEASPLCQRQPATHKLPD
jgi:prepilin-type N-terminal cleavage/methylation domain-containing protein